jgi:hypothetical protein
VIGNRGDEVSIDYCACAVRQASFLFFAAPNAAPAAASFCSAADLVHIPSAATFVSSAAGQQTSCSRNFRSILLLVDFAAPLPAFVLFSLLQLLLFVFPQFYFLLLIKFLLLSMFKFLLLFRLLFLTHLDYRLKL